MSYAKNVLEINLDQKDFTAQEKELLSKKGLHKITETVNFNGLRESEYKNKNGEVEGRRSNREKELCEGDKGNRKKSRVF